MNDRLLDKYTGQSPTGEHAGSETEPEDLGVFGYLRGSRDLAVMLELRKNDGQVLAVGYGWIERMEYQPETGITLHLPGRKITISGSALNTAPDTGKGASLFAGLVRHRVPWVRESGRNESLGASGSSVSIDSIRWEE